GGEIAASGGGGELLGEPPLLIEVGPETRGLGFRADMPAGPARELSNSRRRPADDRRELVERHLEDVVEYERGALGRGELFEHDQQGHANGVVERDAVGGVGPERREVHHRLGEPRPDVAGAPGRCWPQLIATQPAGHGNEPAAHVVDAVDAMPYEPGIRLLHDVLGVADAPEHAVRDIHHALAVIAPGVGNTRIGPRRVRYWLVVHLTRR